MTDEERLVLFAEVVELMAEFLQANPPGDFSFYETDPGYMSCICAGDQSKEEQKMNIIGYFVHKAQTKGENK